MSQPKGSSTEIDFTQLVQIVRANFNYSGRLNLGYAEAAKIVDRAIAPQIHAKLSELLEKRKTTTLSIDANVKPEIKEDCIPVTEIEKMLEELR